ncbi:hypothetical protein GOP47_0009510 [Adiantum capillus-veneris]|uniref:Major facilitator superfamily (MFS) profile domain-containing protein n=1 Tax=Adiantum capillus-veneris TaxID=13818 RepID=A0A9D4UX04_ADICA|nr:hypothetical protein GOP47_0009510 [Adiantum capillus-veneris]
MDEPLLPDNEKQTQRLSIDQVLQEWAGELGSAQLRHFTLVSLAWWLPCFLTFVMVFADQTPEWVCTSTFQSSSAIAFPAHNVSSSLFPPIYEPPVAAAQILHRNNASCTPTSSICSLAPSLWNWVDGEEASTVSRWGLICGNSYKVGLVQCMFFLGISIGAGIWGGLSDSSLGRKGVLIVTCCLSSILCLLTAFSPNYWVYVALRLATGLSAGGVGPSAFVLATEVVGPSKRGPATSTAFLCFPLFKSRPDDGIEANTVEVRKAGIIDIFKMPATRRRMVIMLFIWLTNGVCYFGINLNVQNVGDVWEAAGAGMFTSPFSTYNLVFIYTAELFPTEVRNVAIGLASQAAQVGAVSAPLVAAAAKIHEWIPFVVFSGMTIIASCLACYLPETLEKRMHETMHGMLV